MVPLKDTVGAHLLLQGSDMALSQISHMDEVSDSGTVRRWIVIAKDIQMWQVSTGHSLDVRHQVVGDTLGVFTNET